jgi:hypothetical protein
LSDRISCLKWLLWFRASSWPLIDHQWDGNLLGAVDGRAGRGWILELTAKIWRLKVAEFLEQEGEDKWVGLRENIQ